MTFFPIKDHIHEGKPCRQSEGVANLGDQINPGGGENQKQQMAPYPQGNEG
jgi:hypothetical protein